MDVESRKKIVEEYQIQSENMYNDIFRELSWQTVDDLNLKMKVTELDTVVNKVLRLHLKEIPPTKEALDALTKSWSFSGFYSKYIKDYRSKLEKILFTKMTLQDIRELYNRPEGEQSNGQAENAE